MSLDKAIKHKKEHRKPYYGSKAFSQSCRCHGGCKACLENRTHSERKRKLSAEEQIESYESESII